jgi:hypothetical protein
VQREIADRQHEHPAAISANGRSRDSPVRGQCREHCSGAIRRPFATHQALAHIVGEEALVRAVGTNREELAAGSGITSEQDQAVQR